MQALLLVLILIYCYVVRGAKCNASCVAYNEAGLCLPRDEGSWARPEIPRLERVCQLCGVGTLGDERHLIFECPELLCFREQWSHLFEGPQTMQAFMRQEDLIGVAKFVTACLRKMNPSYEGQTSDQPGVAGRDVI